MALKDVDPLLDKLIGLDCDLRASRRKSPAKPSDSPLSRAMDMGLSFKEADRAACMARYYRLPVEEIVRRNL
jgi:hypothetical protein